MQPTNRDSGRLYVLGVLVTLYLGVVGLVTWLWIRWFGVEQSLFDAAICALPVVLAAVLAGTSTADERQYVARLLVCMLFGPALLLFWATSLDPAAGAVERPVWPFATALIVAHVLCFVGVIFWGGTFLTSVAPARGASAVSPGDLRERLFSLNETNVPFEAEDSGANDNVLIVSYRFAADAHRSHHVLLELDGTHRTVRVRERVGAAGARPVTAEEASMRGIGDRYYDPTRPSAKRIYGKTFQTTQIESGRLAAVPLQFRGRSAQLPQDFAAALDGEGMVTLLCALVTRSGWRWQPVFFGRGVE